MIESISFFLYECYGCNLFLSPVIRNFRKKMPGRYLWSFLICYFAGLEGYHEDRGELLSKRWYWRPSRRYLDNFGSFAALLVQSNHTKLSMPMSAFTANLEPYIEIVVDDRI